MFGGDIDVALRCDCLEVVLLNDAPPKLAFHPLQYGRVAFEHRRRLDALHEYLTRLAQLEKKLGTRRPVVYEDWTLHAPFQAFLRARLGAPSHTRRRRPRSARFRR